MFDMHGDGPPCMFPWKQGSKATRYLMVDEKQSLAFPINGHSFREELSFPQHP